MRRVPRTLLLALATLASPLLVAGVAAASQAELLRPIDLRVYDGEESWHPDNDFRLDWDPPPVAAQGFPVTAVDYRVRDAAGTAVIPETHLPWETTVIENIRIPSGRPGIYTADVWLEGRGGERGPQTSATLRFDNVRPASAQPLAPAGWVAGSASARIRIEHPAGPQPISGIRGYAVAVDRGAGAAPCARQDRCSVVETNLRGGIEVDSISLGTLPEGVNVVRAVAVSGSGMRSAEVRSATVRVDATRPTVTLQGASPAWAAGPVQVTAVATDAMSGMASASPNGAFTAIAVDDGVPRLAAGSSVTAIVSGEGTHAIAFYARDTAGNDGEVSPSSALVRIDEHSPRVTFANRQDPADPERIEATVTDPLSGVGTPRGSIAFRPASSHQRFVALPTTALPGRLIARWDSDSSAPGAYEFKATGYDTAGNAAVSDRRANGARMVLASPLKAPTEIEAGFRGGKQARDKTVAYAHGASFIGRARLTSGARLGGLPVQILETFGAGADPSRRISTVQTAADGTFTARLAPGPDRFVEAAFAGNRVLSRSTAPVGQLRVVGGVRMRASATSARVGGAPVSSAEASAISAPQSPPEADRSSSSSASPAPAGPRSAPCRPTAMAASITPTPSATTTAAASASSSAPTPPAKTTGPTSRRARGHSPSQVVEQSQERSGPSDAFTKRAPHAGCMRGSLRGRSAPRPVRSLSGGRLVDQ